MELIAYSIKGKSWVQHQLPITKKDIKAHNKIVPIKKLLCDDYPSQDVTLLWKEKVTPEQFKTLCLELGISPEQLKQAKDERQTK